MLRACSSAIRFTSPALYSRGLNQHFPRNVRYLSETLSAAPTELRFGVLPSALIDLDERVQRSVDLVNASEAEIRQYKIQKAVEKFRRFDGDTGSSEVQVAILSVKIKSMEAHMKAHRKDFHSRRGLQIMVNKRRKLMVHLRKNNFDTYKSVLQEYGLRDIIKQLSENKTRQGKRKVRFRGN